MENIDIDDVLKVVNDLDTNEIINNLRKRTPQITKPIEPVMSVASDEIIVGTRGVPSKVVTNIVLNNVSGGDNIKLYGSSISYSTLYFVAVMVLIGGIIHFLTNKKQKKEKD